MEQGFAGYKNNECFLLVAKSKVGKSVLHNQKIEKPKKKKQIAWLLQPKKE